MEQKSKGSNLVNNVKVDTAKLFGYWTILEFYIFILSYNKFIN